jgi:hypothetical protein
MARARLSAQYDLAIWLVNNAGMRSKPASLRANPFRARRRRQSRPVTKEENDMAWALLDQAMRRQAARRG